jgi:hypothetical protein
MSTSMPFILLLHILGGLTGVFSGFATLVLRKGSIPHRNIGRLFVISMLVMGLSGTYRATFVHIQPINAVAGLFVAYLVASSGLTVRQPTARIGRWEFLVMLVGVATAVGSLYLAHRAAQESLSNADGSATGLVVFSVLLTVGVAGDINVLIRGGVTGAQRLLRHLWRACFALFMAASSLFLATPSRILPRSIADTPVRWVLPIAITAMYVYWFIRTLRMAVRERRKRALTEGGMARATR